MAEQPSYFEIVKKLDNNPEFHAAVDRAAESMVPVAEQERTVSDAPYFEDGDTYSYVSVHDRRVTWTRNKDGEWFADDDREMSATDVDVLRNRLVAAESERDRLRAERAGLRAAAVVAFKGPGATDASYLLTAAEHLEGGYVVGGSNVTATVIRTLRAVASLLADGETGEQV